MPNDPPFSKPPLLLGVKIKVCAKPNELMQQARISK
jgi:hypothetical protein